MDTCVLANELLGLNTSQLQQKRTEGILVIFAPFSVKIRDLTASHAFASVKALDLKAEGTHQCEGAYMHGNMANRTSCQFRSYVLRKGLEMISTCFPKQCV